MPREVGTKEVQSRHSMTYYPYTTAEKAPQPSTGLTFDLNDAPSDEEGCQSRSQPDLGTDLGLGLNYEVVEVLQPNMNTRRDTLRRYNNIRIQPYMNPRTLLQNPANPNRQPSHSNLTRSHTQPHIDIQPHNHLSYPYPSSAQTPGLVTIYVGTPSNLDQTRIQKTHPPPVDTELTIHNPPMQMANACNSYSLPEFLHNRPTQNQVPYDVPIPGQTTGQHTYQQSNKVILPSFPSYPFAASTQTTNTWPASVLNEHPHLLVANQQIEV